MNETMTSFTTVVWTNIVEETALSFRLTADETEKLRNGDVAMLIAAIPFLAGCDDAERTSLSHLAIYLIAAKGSRYTFDHNEHDNVQPFDRLRTGMHFSGGNQKIIQRGMAQLALVMLEGYNFDRVKDELDGNYNPLNAGAWNYDEVKQTLVSLIANTDCPDMDDIVDSQTVYGYWNAE